MSLITTSNGNTCARPAAPLAGVLDQFLGEVFPGAWRETAAPRRGVQGFYPAVEITRGDNEALLRVELPGVSKDDIEMTIHDDTLTIKGVKKYEKQENNAGWSYSERSYGEFVRTFSVPKTLDADKVRADFKDGVLEVRLPVVEAAKPRKVDINAN